MTRDDAHLSNVEWDMLDKRKFVSLCATSSFCVRWCAYPLTVIKTRQQIQKHDVIYTGLRDAAVKIYRSEGFAGLYRGFWVDSARIVSGVVYVTVNEGFRHILSHCGAASSAKALVAGGAASLAAQTVVVPLDVISQHVIVSGLLQRGGKIADTSDPFGASASGSGLFKFRTALEVVHNVYQKDGPRGFYRGYLASVLTHVPYSAIWWSFYQLYRDVLHARLPDSFPTASVQFASGSLCGATTAVLTNPMDIVRARIQVFRTKSTGEIIQRLWREEGVRIFTKGLSARILHSIIFSSLIIVGYEAIKRVAVKDEYKDMVH